MRWRRRLRTGLLLALFALLCGLRWQFWMLPEGVFVLLLWPFLLAITATAVLIAIDDSLGGGERR